MMAAEWNDSSPSSPEKEQLPSTSCGEARQPERRRRSRATDPGQPASTLMDFEHVAVKTTEWVETGVLMPKVAAKTKAKEVPAKAAAKEAPAPSWAWRPRAIAFGKTFCHFTSVEWDLLASCRVSIHASICD